MQLTRHARWAQIGYERSEIGAAHPVDVERGALKRAQQPLLGALEEVQSLDRAIPLALRLAESGKVTLAVGGDLDRREELQVASITAQKNLTQIDQAVRQ